MATFVNTGGATVMGTSQTGNVTTDTVARANMTTPAAIVITNVAGGGPTVTANIQGSVDGVNFFNIPYALVGAPSTFVLTAITITASVTTAYLLQPNQPWKYVNVAYSANTNETLTTTYYSN